MYENIKVCEVIKESKMISFVTINEIK